MGDLIDINGGFDLEWSKATETVSTGGEHWMEWPEDGQPVVEEYKLPKGFWSIWYDASRLDLHPHFDGQAHSKFVRPEFDIKEEQWLREDERVGQPNALILSSPHTYKLFKDSGAWRAEVLRMDDLRKGKYRLRVNIKPDPVVAKDEQGKIYATDRAAFVYFASNDEPSELIDLTPSPDNPRESPWHQLTHEFYSVGGYTIYGVGFYCPFAIKNSCFFTDDWTLEYLGETSERGKPRTQYERTYVLLHTSAGKEWANAVNEATWDNNHYTLGSSADDAGIGDLDVRKIVAVNPQLWGPGEDGRGLLGFYETHYPGVDARQVVVDTPAALIALLMSTPFDDLPQLEPYEEPTPPNDGEPDNSPPDEITTWHRQTNEDGLDQYPEGMPVEAIKLVLGGEDAVHYMQKGYQTADIRYVVSHQGQFIDAMNVNGFLANFDDSVDQVVTDVQAHFPGRAIYLETTNEEDPNNPRVIEFECRASDEIYRRWHPYVIGVLGNFAVGNGEGQALLPLAQTAYKNKHLIGYHMYFPVDLVNAERWMVEEAKWYHMRMLYHIDPVFRANKVFPLYASTEGGPVKAIAQGSFAAMFSRAAAWARREPITGPRVATLDPAWLEAKRLWNESPVDAEFAQRLLTDPALTAAFFVGPLDPGGGWRHPDALNADLARAIALKMQKRQMILDWNAAHGHRMRFDAEFTVGADFVGWKWFKWWRDDILAVRSAILGK